MAYDVQEYPRDNKVTTVLDDNGYTTRTLTRKFSIKLDSPSADSVAVEAGAQVSGTPTPLPSRGTGHPDYPTFQVRNIETVATSLLLHDSTVTYSTPSAPEGEDSVEPVDMTAKIKYITVREDRTIDDDYNGDPLVNEGTNEAYQFVVEQVDLAVNVTKNYATFDPITIYLFNDKVNSDPFYLPGASSPLPAGTAKIDNITADTATHNGAEYWVVSVDIVIREPRADDDPAETWYERILHKGYYAMTDDDPPVKYRIALNSSGTLEAYDPPNNTAVTQPELLNENGEVLGSEEDPYYQKKQTKGTINFNSLGLF